MPSMQRFIQHLSPTGNGVSAFYFIVEFTMIFQAIRDTSEYRRYWCFLGDLMVPAPRMVIFAASLLLFLGVFFT